MYQSSFKKQIVAINEKPYRNKSETTRNKDENTTVGSD